MTDANVGMIVSTIGWRMCGREGSWSILTFPCGYFKLRSEDNHENLVEVSLGIAFLPPQNVTFQEINVVYDFSHSQSQDILLNGDSVFVTEKFRAAAMLVLLMTGKQENSL